MCQTDSTSDLASDIASAGQVYAIRLKGHLDRRRASWFEGMSITLEEGGTTLLCGPVVDQPALHGLLRKVRDLGMPLIAVSLIEQPPTD